MKAGIITAVGKIPVYGDFNEPRSRQNLCHFQRSSPFEKMHPVNHEWSSLSDSCSATILPSQEPAVPTALSTPFACAICTNRPQRPL